MLYWYDYRYIESEKILINHPNVQEYMFFEIAIVSERLANFVWTKSILGKFQI